MLWYPRNRCQLPAATIFFIKIQQNILIFYQGIHPLHTLEPPESLKSGILSWLSLLDYNIQAAYFSPICPCTRKQRQSILFLLEEHLHFSINIWTTNHPPPSIFYHHIRWNRPAFKSNFVLEKPHRPQNSQPPQS